MEWKRWATYCEVALAIVLLGLFPIAAMTQAKLEAGQMAQIGVVDPRFFSYNIEAVEITGGRFWKPYSEVEHQLNDAAHSKPNLNQPVGMDPSLFQYRSPIDLTNPRLRRLAAALEPAYVRVSGTWRNTTFFQDNDEPALKIPPTGFNGVMTRAQWRGVVDFSRAVGAEIVTSVAVSAGTRDENGKWTSSQAKKLFDYTKQLGGQIAATEFMNEPTFATIGGAPKGYTATNFGADVKAFRSFLRQESPDTIFLGPGSVGEGAELVPSGGPRLTTLSSDDLLKATGPAFDAFSYHFYGGVSRRCTASLGPNAGLNPKDALSPEWLARNLAVESFYAKLRDTYLPGKDLWLTETGQAACGGDKWAADYIDSFRLLDQLGTLAQKGVRVVMQNTLASSDYGLLDERTLEPRPNYWAALLWKKTMGERVLDAGIEPTPTLKVFAQCMNGMSGGVTVLVLNMDKTSEASLSTTVEGQRYTLSSPDLFSKSVLLNGDELHVSQDGEVPGIRGHAEQAGTLRFAPLTMTFITMPGAGNKVCMR